MELVDLARYGFFATFGVGTAFMVATNVLAFLVLRPPKKIGFLWWHVTAISLSFLCFGSVVLSRTMNGLDNHLAPTWHTYVTAVGVLTFTSAQVIIFNVERQRYVYFKSLKLLPPVPEMTSHDR